ncbi:histidine kinase N-terminal 7TM domain-containing protein [Salinigranum sp. GCM10025319]|uniref:histidine kinase N-terminal 7TM domain-containing protein n=1 Tax=Salinigranum sp. GCM10025319 TaxID=3252687 RepID=UPI003623FAFE
MVEIGAVGSGGWPVAAVLPLVSFALALGVVVATWFQRRLPGRTPFGVMMLLVAVWCVSYTGELLTIDPVVGIRFARLTRVAVAYTPVAWFVFAVDYTGRGPRVTPRMAVALLVVPTITAVLAVAGHPALLAPAPTAGTGATSLTLVRGPWFWLHVAYSYLLVAAGTALFVVMHVVASGRPKHVAVILTAVAVPWLANAVYLSGFVPLPLDPTPTAFVVTGVLFAVSVTEWDLFDTLPVAREVARDAVIETMDHGVVILSDDGRVLDMNPSAERVFTGLAVGDPFDSAEAIDLGTGVPTEVELARDGERRRYELRESSFDHVGGIVSGRLLTVRDVTRIRRHGQRLAVLSRILRHDLRNDLNVVKGHAELLAEDPTEAPESPAVIRRKAERLVDLATKVREAEQTLGRSERQVAEIDLAGLARDRVDDARRERPFAEFDLDVPPTPVHVRASDLLAVAVDNLLENAVVHADSLSPTVAVTVRGNVGPESAVELVVADDGPGIPPGERQVLVDGTETPLEHGSGIGLWVVNWIVSESMGEVSFGENDPTGSVVTIRLPAAGSTA